MFWPYDHYVRLMLRFVWFFKVGHQAKTCTSIKGPGFKLWCSRLAVRGIEWVDGDFTCENVDLKVGAGNLKDQSVAEEAYDDKHRPMSLQTF